MQGIVAVKKLLQEIGKEVNDSTFTAVVRAIARIGVSGTVPSAEFVEEARTCNAILEALGYQPIGNLDSYLK